MQETELRFNSHNSVHLFSSLATISWPRLLFVKEVIWQLRWTPVGGYHQVVIKITHQTAVSLEEMYRFINL